MMTPLHWASDRGYTEIISTLLAHSADVNARDKDNQTPLHYACACGHLSGAKQLLQAGADLNAKDADGMSPLELAEDQFRSELMST
ncbi:acyl-CoA-binding domain-containing protein 2 [Clonorchis sinensis]|uniref:Acyl-CoA-binding domain-containing protein 2 n=2 Tax=Clonorchis sinensis TaxID=79923 RepID=G7YGV2_CLOSI|nr:acyl-CoA-binding domain-containing protein 2 [Clonorchis sinensis]